MLLPIKHPLAYLRVEVLAGLRRQQRGDVLPAEQARL